MKKVNIIISLGWLIYKIIFSFPRSWPGVNFENFTTNGLEREIFKCSFVKINSWYVSFRGVGRVSWASNLVIVDWVNWRYFCAMSKSFTWICGFIKILKNYCRINCGFIDFELSVRVAYTLSSHSFKRVYEKYLFEGHNQFIEIKCENISKMMEFFNFYMYHFK